MTQPCKILWSLERLGSCILWLKHGQLQAWPRALSNESTSLRLETLEEQAMGGSNLAWSLCGMFKEWPVLECACSMVPEATPNLFESSECLLPSWIHQWLSVNYLFLQVHPLFRLQSLELSGTRANILASFLNLERKTSRKNDRLSVVQSLFAPGSKDKILILWSPHNFTPFMKPCFSLWPLS